jgi:hypothetical protein
MKKLLIILIILSSCSKPVENLAPIEKSVTYLRHLYNDNGQYLTTDTSIHWCKVSGEDLRMYEAKGSGEITFCGTYNRLELVIGEACKSSFK